MKLKQFIATAVTALSLLGATQAFAQNNEQITFPDVSQAWLKGGTFVDVEQLRRMGPDMSPNQVRELLSYPHFKEGLFLSNWNYIFNFRTGKGNEYVTCQYQVQFKDGRTSATYWREPDCAPYVTPIKPITQNHPITLKSDGLFEFGRSGLNDLQQGGRDDLAILVGQVKTGYSNLRSIDIAGYTDRIGTAQGNMALSLARANSVKQYLVSQGIPGNLIHTTGMGSTNPVVYCDGPKTPAVVACLMPNRRIEVSVTGDK